jgi:hypothetical protein
MISSKGRDGKRYNLLFGFDLIAEYSHIFLEHLVISDIPSVEESYEERRSAVVHNISRDGICLSFEDTQLDVGREIDLILTLSNPASEKGNVSLECIAEVLWVSEAPAGFRAGLKFTEVPEDFPEIFERIVSLLEKEQLVR